MSSSYRSSLSYFSTGVNLISLYCLIPVVKTSNIILLKVVRVVNLVLCLPIKGRLSVFSFPLLSKKLTVYPWLMTVVILRKVLLIILLNLFIFLHDFSYLFVASVMMLGFSWFINLPACNEVWVWQEHFLKYVTKIFISLYSLMNRWRHCSILIHAVC